MTLWGGSGTFCGFPWQILFTVGVSRSQALLTQRDSEPGWEGLFSQSQVGICLFSPVLHPSGL